MSDNEQAEDAADAEAEAAEDAGAEGEETIEETAEDETAEATEEATDEAETEDEPTGLQDGDFVRIAYTIRTKEDGRVIDTTDEEVAEESDIDTEEYEFEPRVITLGAGHIFDPVEDALQGSEVGEEGSIEIPAVDAFGEYDPDEVETVKADRIPEDDRYPGAQVQIDQQQGHVEAIIGGRARVDFNHPLAGEDLEYEYELLEIVEDDEEKAASLLGMYLQEEPEVRIETVTEEEEVTTEFHEEDEEGEEIRETELQEVEKDVLYVEATPQMQMNQQWMFSKQQIAQDLMGRLGLDRVVVEEVIEGGGMPGMGGMMGGMGAGGGDIEDALEDADVDPEEIVDELEEE